MSDRDMQRDLPRETQRAVRDRLVRTYRELGAGYKALLARGADLDTVDAAREASMRVQRRYFAALPRVAYAACPYDGLPLVRAFDPFGLDGPWWGPNGVARELKACPHYCMVGGAVRFDGRPPRGGPERVYPGPEVPFVYPRILDLPGMIAVIATLPMEYGLRAYAISYFAEPRPSGEQLGGGWKATTHGWTTQMGERGFRMENEAWDFELAPWLARGKVRWCTQGTDNTVLADPSEPCPYIGLPGARRNHVVQGEHVSYMGLPDGDRVDPFSG